MASYKSDPPEASGVLPLSTTAELPMEVVGPVVLALGVLLVLGWLAALYR